MAGVGTTGALIAAIACAFAVLSAVLAVEGFSGAPATPEVATVGAGALALADGPFAGVIAGTRSGAFRSASAGGGHVSRRGGPGETAPAARPLARFHVSDDAGGPVAWQAPGDRAQTPGAGSTAPGSPASAPAPAAPAPGARAPAGGSGGGGSGSDPPSVPTQSPDAPPAGGLGGAVTQATNGVGTTVAQTGQQLGGAVQGVTSQLGGAVGQVSPSAGQLVTQTGQAVGGTVGGATGAVGQVVQGAGNAVGGLLGGLGGARARR